MQKYTADLIVTNDGPAIENGTIIINETTGEILEVLPESESIEGAKHLKGIIVPGYVNAHCHLELSHLKGIISTGTGLIPFIEGVVTLRDFEQHIIDQKIIEADQYMYDSGIVAVGDISNKIDTAAVKRSSKIRYYTFVEMFDFLQEANAQATFDQYQEVYQGQSGEEDGNNKSFVPHAPYSVSQQLFDKVNQYNTKGATISIHNQELQAENELFLRKEGRFLDFYKNFNIPLTAFQATGQTSIYYMMEHLKPDFKTLMVHNTQTTKEEIRATVDWNPDVHWVTCPNANLYIENALPNYQHFIETEANVCIGTDSLSSNWQLSIFEEMKTIKKFQSGVEDQMIIKWATRNGALALGYEDLGVIAKGWTPGLNHIDVKVDNGQFDLTEAVSSNRLC